jgi:sugar phosphate isomerase/epimerase
MHHTPPSSRAICPGENQPKSQTAAQCTRRTFAKWSAAVWPALGWLSAAHRLAAADTTRKPNSKFAGVQVGLNVPYSFSDGSMSAQDILKNCVQLGLSAVELRAQPVEIFLGASAELIFPKKPVDLAAAAGARTALATWRQSVSMERVKEFRKRYEDAGVLIEVVKIDGLFKLSDAELDYVFTLTKTLGGRAISTEISTQDEELKRVGQFADRHRLMVGYHGHATTKPEHWERAFSLAKYNGANVDLGHFVAGNNVSPAAFIQKHHERVTHVHVKDRKKENGPNMLFGEGDTPIVEVLQLIRDQKWNIQATIEFEYKIPPGSDRMTEIARTIKYCREALERRA